MLSKTPNLTQGRSYIRKPFFGWEEMMAVFAVLLFFGSCTQQSTHEKKTVETLAIKPAPDFNADSAYAFVKHQVDFGPRIPGSDSHKKCGDWMVSQLKSHGAEVTEQIGEVHAFDNIKLPLRNIIASFNPEKTRRVMLCAHWDTRPFADQDRNPDQHQTPIDGANDGGSGVAVLMEIARQLAVEKPSIGVDLIFFDVEDYGRPAFDHTPDASHYYCLGSRYWGENLHEENYTASYAILLDMVGAQRATFSMEGVSMQYAPRQTRKVWDTASQLGYGRHFMYQKTYPITDDHVYVNTLANIPTMDIIEYNGSTLSNFSETWHTHNDNMEVIDSSTLKAVGQTLLQVIFNE